MNALRRFIQPVALLMISGLIAVTGSTTVLALDPFGEACKSGGSSAICDEKDKGPSVAEIIGNVVKVMMMILGAVAVVMIVIAGIRFATSGGSSETIKSARETILYAVVGLVIAISAYAITDFVIKQFS